jgi:2-keto-3-deoxy-L-rhamnonate aldolase RhmA
MTGLNPLSLDPAEDNLMRRNKLRELLNAGQPTIGTHVHSVWPSVVEILGHTGMFD